MVTINKNKLLYVDVDRTLIIWDKGDKWHRHEEHIDLLKQFKFQGHGVVVWSQGGWEWAENAVRLLGIEELVDVVISKPDWFVDDKHAYDFMPEINRIFLRENT